MLAWIFESRQVVVVSWQDAPYRNGSRARIDNCFSQVLVDQHGAGHKYRVTPSLEFGPLPLFTVIGLTLINARLAR